MEKGKGGGNAKNNEPKNDKNERGEIITAAKGDTVKIWPDFKKNNTNNVRHGIDNDRKSGKKA